MHILRLPLFVPLHYWRTLLLATCAGFGVAAAVRDELAVMLCTLACVFVFMDYERRRWISVSPYFLMGDILFRVCLALSLTYALGRQLIA